MSSMYLYCAFQSSDEFSALQTICIAISFFAGSSRPVACTAASACGAYRETARPAAGAAARDRPSSRVVRRVGRFSMAPPRGVRGWTVRKLSYQTKRRAENSSLHQGFVSGEDGERARGDPDVDRERAEDLAVGVRRD